MTPLLSTFAATTLAARATGWPQHKQKWVVKNPSLISGNQACGGSAASYQSRSFVSLKKEQARVILPKHFFHFRLAQNRPCCRECI